MLMLMIEIQSPRSSTRKSKSKSESLSRDIQNPAALLAVDDLFPRLGIFHRGDRQFHVTTGADPMFDRNDCGVAFAREQSLETVEQIFVHFFGEFFSFLRELLKPRIERFGFFAEIVHLAID